MCIWVCVHTLVGVNLGRPVAVKGEYWISVFAAQVGPLCCFSTLYSRLTGLPAPGHSPLSLCSPIRLEELSILELSLAFFYMSSLGLRTTSHAGTASTFIH